MGEQLRRRVVIVGGGITGLAAAWQILEECCREPVELVLLESSDRFGGVIQTIHRDGFLIEAGPDSFITDKTGAMDLCQQISLGDQLQATRSTCRRALVVRNHKLIPVPAGFVLMGPTRLRSILSSPLFSLRGKLRIAAEPFIRAKSDGQDESVGSFVVRRFGHEMLDRLVQPLVGGIYTADTDVLSLGSTFPRFLEMEARHGSVTRGLAKSGRRRSTSGQSGARYSLFMALHGGMETLVTQLVGQIPRQSLRLGCRVQAIHPRPVPAGRSCAWSVVYNRDQKIDADAVVVCGPSHLAAQLVEPFDHGLAGELVKIRYASSVVINLGYRRDNISHPLDAFGFVVPRKENMSILAGSFSSVKFEGRAPRGHVLLRVFLGGVLQVGLLELDDSRLAALAHKDVAGLLGIGGPPLFSMVHRYDQAMPQYRVDHRKAVEEISRRAETHTGLEIVGNGFEGVGLPDCIRQGQLAARRVMACLAASKPPAI